MKTSFINKIRFLIFFIAVLSYSPAHADDVLELRVGYISIHAHLPFVVSHAAYGSEMEASNVRVKMIRYHSFSGLEAALRVNAIDITAIPVPTILNLAADGKKIRLIGSLHSGNSTLVSAADTDLSHLKGKVIGTPGIDSNEHFVLKNILSLVSFKEGIHYKTIGVSFRSAIRYLENSSIDAMFLPEPFGTMAMKKNICHNVKFDSKHYDAHLSTLITVRDQIVTDHRKQLLVFLKSAVRACNFIEQDINTSGAKQTSIFQKTYFEYPEDIVERSLTSRIGNIFFKPAEPDLELIRTYLNYLSQIKYITTTVDIDSLLASKLMEQAVR